MTRSIRVLLVEDSENDALLLLRQMQKGGYVPISRQVDNAADMLAALDEQSWDLIISDYVIPGFGGLEALELLKIRGLDLPFIIVSGQIGEDLAVRAMKAGAHDYIMKDRLARLIPAVERELREAEMRRERKRSRAALRESEERFRQLAENIEAVFFMFEMSSESSPGRISYVSPIYERIWRDSTEKLLQEPRRWLEAIHPDDGERVRNDLPKMARGDFNLEFRLLMSDSTVRWIHYRAFPILNDLGQVHRVAAIAEDVTERKAGEHRLKSTAEQLLRTVEELRRMEEQLRARNDELSQTRDELEMRVTKRTAALSKANGQLRRQIEERKRLEQELLDITEQERRRLGIDLHDDLGQHLMGLAFMVKGLQQKLEEESPERAAEAEKIHGLVSQTIKHAHDLALDMTSELEGEDLAVALRQLAQRVKTSFAVECQFHSDGDISRLQPAWAAHLYKIAQEALSNAIKHGKARHISLRLAQEQKKLLLSIGNDGLPFRSGTSQNGRMGLRIMNYRAHVIGASLDVSSSEKNGTLVVCRLPLAANLAPVAKGALASPG